MLADFYSREDITEAKVTLLNVFDNLGTHAQFKITHRRCEGSSKQVLELDDIMSVFTYADEEGIVLPTFLSSSPAKMPSIRLADGDLKIIWNKLLHLEEILAKNERASNEALDIGKANSAMLNSVTIDVKSTMMSCQSIISATKSQATGGLDPTGSRRNQPTGAVSRTTINWASIMDDPARATSGEQATTQGDNESRLLPVVRRVIDDDLGTAGCSSPTGSDTERDSNTDRPYTTVYIRKAKCQLAKRKNISPSNNDASVQENSSKVLRFWDVVANNGSVQSNIGASTQNNAKQLSNKNNKSRLI